MSIYIRWIQHVHLLRANAVTVKLLTVTVAGQSPSASPAAEIFLYYIFDDGPRGGHMVKTVLE
jgi:hypothetical protein